MPGVLGVSTDPFDWGAPNLSFSTHRQRARHQPVGAHRSHDLDRRHHHEDPRQADDALRRRLSGASSADSRTDPNARGSFVFTGLYSGNDFADFLLGLPQQASVQFDPDPEQFPVHVLGSVRPGRLARQRQGDRERGAALRILLAAVGGQQSSRDARRGARLHRRGAGDRRRRSVRSPGSCPTRSSGRSAAAWRRASASPGGRKPGTVVRTGYGINYNSSVYQYIAQQLAAQPPLRDDQHAARSRRTRWSRSKRRCCTCSPGARLPTPTAIDPDYRLGYVQIWNLDVQRDLTRTVQLGVGYTGTKGSNLDILRAPNRGPTGLLDSRRAAVHLGIVRRRFDHARADAAPAPAADERPRRRRHLHVVAVDRRCLVGGGRWRDGRAERSGSRGGARAVELRSAASLRRRLHLRAAVRREQAVVQQREPRRPRSATGRSTATRTLASGTPFTARVLGSISDVASGVNGTLRANYNGAADRDRRSHVGALLQHRGVSRFRRRGPSATPAATRSSVPGRR